MVRQTLVGVYRISTELDRRNVYWHRLGNCDVTFSYAVLCALAAYFIAYRLYLLTTIMTLVSGEDRTTPENQ